jgi:hypothetical protein
MPQSMGLPIAVATIAGASEVDHALIGVEASRQNGGCGATLLWHGLRQRDRSCDAFRRRTIATADGLIGLADAASKRSVL